MASRPPEPGAPLARAAVQERSVGDAAAPPGQSAGLPPDVPSQVGARMVPLVPRVPLTWQFKALIAVLLALLLAAAGLVMLDRRQAAHAARYLEAAGAMQMLSQRMASAAQHAVGGEAAAFDSLRAARDEFNATLTLLAAGGERAGLRVPPMTEDKQPLLRELQDAWRGIDAGVALIGAERERLIALRKHERQGTEAAGTAAPEPAAAGGTTYTDAPARQAAQDIYAGSERLLAIAIRLAAGYGGSEGMGSRLILAAALCSGLALVCLLVMGKLILDDAERRAMQSQQAALENERAHRHTQAAILRLLDEMDNLAQGDLTVRASVSEEVTGAIADAVNYAVSELRRVVADIDRAAVDVAGASSQAQEITGELLNAAQRQAQEITETDTAVAIVAQAIVQISARAADSARVAELSLAAAAQGSSAVRRAILGMNGIREQIQDTAKRIKRLGESSQEIGEIVDLISDITEQTNVLALNAAIQASSAGPSGRGFSMVAEEVQRLAERSAQATRQINAIVKTIQADTQDATSAMERSTQGVVEQTGLADATGQALARIDEISRRLATLIGAISAATQEQSESADRIRANMLDIRRITELTTEGTRKTADATARLARLALELKQSVAGFRLS